jgi:hypothetical protein
MSRGFRLVAVLGAAVIAVVTFAAPASAQTQQLCGRFDSVNVAGGQMFVMNNVWGSTTPQCINVNTSTGAFQITQSGHNNTNGQVASYPAIVKGCHWGTCTPNSGLPLQVGRIQSAVSSWNITTGAPGIWNAAYDIWYHTDANVNRGPDGAELMIWLNRAGGAGPAGPQVGTVSIGGASWAVHFAEFTDWNYIAYIRTTPTNSVSNLDIRAFTLDAVNRGYIQSGWYLSGVEAGFELWVNGAGLASNSFSFTAQGGTQTTPPTSPPPPTSSPPPPGGCAVDWDVNDWGGGFVANLTITNRGAPINGWQLTWTFPGNQQITNFWGTQLTQSGQAVTAQNAPWNGGIGTGGTAQLGFQAGYSGSNQRPSSIQLNGTSCTIT